MDKIKEFDVVCRLCKKLQKQGKRIVFCHGFFDILHRGHVTLLVEAKKLGDILVVGIDHDDNAKILKGPKRPINNHESRMFVLANLEPVDFVFLTPSFKKKAAALGCFLGLYKTLKPDFVATSVKAGKFGKVRRKQAKEAGIEFVDIDHGIYDRKTTKIIEILGLE